MVTANTEVEAKQDGGLPQFDPASFETQLIWLFLSFIILYVIVSKLFFPRVRGVMEEREERIAGDLDTAERSRGDAEEIKAAYEASVAASRSQAQKAAVEAKEKNLAELSKAQAELDAKLNAEAEEAGANVKAAMDEALAGLDVIASDVAKDIVAKLTNTEADDAKVSKAVKAALVEAKGA